MFIVRTRTVIHQVLHGRVSEPDCFGAASAPAPAPGIFYPEPAGEREHNQGIFLNWLQIV